MEGFKIRKVNQRSSRVYIRLAEFLFRCVKMDVNYSITKSLIAKIEEFPDIYIEEIAMLANTTPASVTKFCKRLGYASFKDLRTDLDVYSHEVILQDVQDGQTPEHAIEEFLKNDQRRQQDMFTRFDRDQCIRIAQALRGKGKVGALGRTSMFSSLNILRELLSINDFTVYEINRRSSIDVLEDALKAMDGVFLFCLTGEWLEESAERRELLRNLDAYKVLITRADMEDTADIFDEVVSLQEFDYLLLSNYYSQKVIQSWVLVQATYIEGLRNEEDPSR